MPGQGCAVPVEEQQQRDGFIGNMMMMAALHMHWTETEGLRLGHVDNVNRASQQSTLGDQQPGSICTASACRTVPQCQHNARQRPQLPHTAANSMLTANLQPVMPAHVTTIAVVAQLADSHSDAVQAHTHHCQIHKPQLLLSMRLAGNTNLYALQLNNWAYRTTLVRPSTMRQLPCPPAATCL